ncbi:MAG: hypothetical protein IJX70_03490 [Clostridia bacterium]|nr:hypothetical protein [Clostridia bacterium]
MKTKIIAFSVMATVILVAIISLSVAWYASSAGEEEVTANSLGLTTSTSASLQLRFPDGPTTAERYKGQTGTQYEGEDHPYYLVYDGVELSTSGQKDENKKLTISISQVKIILASTDDEGNNLVETYTADTEVAEGEKNPYDYFTVRAYLKQVVNVETDEILEDYTANPIPYLLENNYLVSVSDATFFDNGQNESGDTVWVDREGNLATLSADGNLLYKGYGGSWSMLDNVYSIEYDGVRHTFVMSDGALYEDGYPVREPFTMQNNKRYVLQFDIIFQNEEYYAELMETKADLSEDCATPISHPKYMYCTLGFGVDSYSADLVKITLLPNSPGAGTVQGDYSAIETTGCAVVDLRHKNLSFSASDDWEYVFDGWYTTKEGVRTRFEEDDLVANPVRNDFSLSAGWIKKARIHAHLPQGDTPWVLWHTEHILPGNKATAPHDPGLINGRVFVAWIRLGDGFSVDANGRILDANGTEISVANKNYEPYVYDFDHVLSEGEDVQLYGLWEKYYEVRIDMYIGAARHIGVQRFDYDEASGTFVATSDFYASESTEEFSVMLPASAKFSSYFHEDLPTEGDLEDDQTFYFVIVTEDTNLNCNRVDGEGNLTEITIKGDTCEGRFQCITLKNVTGMTTSAPSYTVGIDGTEDPTIEELFYRNIEEDDNNNKGYEDGYVKLFAYLKLL